MKTSVLLSGVPVGAAAVRRAAELPAEIFAGYEQWGWEYRPPGPVAVPPDSPHPVCRFPTPDWAPGAARVNERVARQRVLLAVLVLGLAVWYVIAGWYTFAGLSGARNLPDVPNPERTRLEREAASRYLKAHPFTSDPWHYLSMGPDLAAILLLAGVLLWIAVGPVARWRAAAAYRRWLGEVRDALDDYTRRLGPWSQRRRAAREQESERIGSMPHWYPLGPKDDGRLDVYGGTPRGWCCLLLTMGASLVGAGARLTVLDLSRERVAEPLMRLAATHGRSVQHLPLPAGAAELDLLAGLDHREAADALVAAAHAAADSVQPETHTLDLRVLGGVCEILAPELTVARVCAGLRRLLHAEPYPSADSVLTVPEYERLGEAFGEVSRQTLEARIATIEARLHPLLRFAGAAGRSVLDSSAEVSVVELDEDAGDLAAGMLAPLLLSIAATQAHRGAGYGEARGALVVAGADLIPRAQLERLDRIARRRDLRLSYLFRHLREDAEEMLGTGGPVVLMRVGNAKQGEAAANFIGREHRFVLNQLTLGAGTGTNEGRSTTHTHGTSRSTTEGRSFGAGSSFSTSTTVGTSESTARGDSEGTNTSFNESAGRQRSYDLTVEPRQLANLPETALFLVDPDVHDGPRVRLGDCNPWLVTAPGGHHRPRPALAGSAGRSPFRPASRAG
jgi:hypothetical protein